MVTFFYVNSNHLQINGEEGIHSVCRSQYGRLDEITFVLNANLVVSLNKIKFQFLGNLEPLV